MTRQLLLLAAASAALAIGSPAARGAEPATNEVRIVAIEGTRVEISTDGGANWVMTQTNQVLRPSWLLRTGPNTRATLRWSEQSICSFGPLTEIEILPPHTSEALSGLHLFQGILSFFHRDKPGRIRILTKGTAAGVEGTEFAMTVDSAERTTLSVIDGQVQFTNDNGTLTLTNGQQAIAELGREPKRTPGFIAQNVLQWCFYYPAVLDLRDLPLTTQEEQVLGESIAAYRAGDLLQALSKYPASHAPGSDSERLYYAALLLSVGEVDKTEAALAKLPAADPSDRLPRLAHALRLLIAAVKRQTYPPTLSPLLSPLPSELLASSYYAQSRATGDASLHAALQLARQAATNSPQFGFAWERVAELEFSFGRTEAALQALNKSLGLAPRNAQALALNGFLLAAENKPREAIVWFNQAIATDSALGNAWLGRGLCKIRLGPGSLISFPHTSVPASALEDLLVAAALETQRSLPRSYLGKAYASAGDDNRADHELKLARELDPRDPTAWLYSALLKQQENRINEAISDLETSQELNDNRSLFRSRLLLDEDRAVRSANLASIYRDAGMFEVSMREASSAVTADYANYSAHLFLANSYNQLRDPELINLRFETATFSEYLLANLLSPVGGTTLSPYVSQQEYSRLFERDRLGLSSQTTYSSRGDWQQQASQYGWVKDTGYALDVFYESLNGTRPNDDLGQLAYSAQVKQQLTPQDSVYLQAVINHVESGDVRQYYDQSSASSTLRVDERQEPNLFLGYHHEWSPGVHTLFLGGRLKDNFQLTDSNVLIRGVVRDQPGGVVTNTVEQICADFGIPNPSGCDNFNSLTMGSQFEAYSAELQQIVQFSRNTVILGGRYQGGETETQTTETRAAGSFPPYGVGSGDFVSAQRSTTDLSRLSFYGYDQWQIVDPLLLIAGLSYDHLHYPRNVDSPPVSAEETTEDQVSPKAGFIWTPTKTTTIRGAYSRSLGGLFYDSSVRLEPVQIAGFTQAYRSLIPESVEGNIPGSQFQTFGFGIEQKFTTGTYAVLGAELLKSDSSRDVGVFDFDPSGNQAASPSQLNETLQYQERSLNVSLNQLLGREWAFGVRYRVSKAELETQFPGVSSAVIPQTDNQAILHVLNLFAIYNHPSGFFAEAQAVWHGQTNYGYEPALPGDDFWQFDLFAGYRFPRRQAEISVGLLNLTDQDYHLNPLNLYAEPPRERTLVVSLKFNF